MIKALRNPGFLAAFAVLALAGVGISAAIAKYKLYLKKEPIYAADGRLLTAVPMETENWKVEGGERRESAEIEKTLGTTNYISRMYVKKNPEGGEPVAIDFHVAYYTGMVDTVPHVPERCFVGGGMQIGKFLGELPLPMSQDRWYPHPDAPLSLQSTAFRINLPGNDYSSRPGVGVTLPLDPAAIRLRTMEFRANQEKPVYSGYFFVANGGHVSRAEGVRALAFDLRSTYAYYMKVQFTSVRGIHSGEDLAREGAALLDDLFGEVMLCTPDWIEVELGKYPPGGSAPQS